MQRAPMVVSLAQKGMRKNVEIPHLRQGADQKVIFCSWQPTILIILLGMRVLFHQ